MAAPNHPRRVWVFALHMDADDFARLTASPSPWGAFEDAALVSEDTLDPVAALLGVSPVDPDFVEIFDVADLGAFGLVRTLIEGNEMEASQVLPDGARLGALTGPVLLVFSAAFDRPEVTFDPDPRATLIGTYSTAAVAF